MDVTTNLFLEFRDAIPDEWLDSIRLEEVKNIACALRDANEVKTSLENHIILFARVLDLLSFVSLKLRKAKLTVERAYSKYEVESRKELKAQGESSRLTKDYVKAHILETRMDYIYLQDGLEGLKALEDYLFGLRTLALSRENIIKERSINDRVEERDLSKVSH